MKPDKVLCVGFVCFFRLERALNTTVVYSFIANQWKRAGYA